jgi:hypothetical protein
MKKREAPEPEEQVLGYVESTDALSTTSYSTSTGNTILSQCRHTPRTPRNLQLQHKTDPPQQATKDSTRREAEK